MKSEEEIRKKLAKETKWIKSVPFEHAIMAIGYAKALNWVLKDTDEKEPSK